MNSSTASEPGLLREAMAIARFHIVLIAMVACLTFGWIESGHYLWWLPTVVATDWFVINLVNRITDIDEDLRNGIPGTQRVARRKVGLTIFAFVLLTGSLLATHIAWPQLTVWRLVVQVIGLAYNYRIVPAFTRSYRPEGLGQPRSFRLSRFKELWFFKNFMSAVLFVFTCLVYPHVITTSRVARPGAMVALALFFVPFELTYEILYDLRDLDGDRQEGVPTYPVVQGPKTAKHIINVLLMLAAVVLMFGVAIGVLGLRELLMLVAVVAQFFFYRARVQRGLTTRDCIGLTHLGSAQLALFLVGTWVWLRFGLPHNVYVSDFLR